MHNTITQYCCIYYPCYTCYILYRTCFLVISHPYLFSILMKIFYACFTGFSLYIPLQKQYSCMYVCISHSLFQILLLLMHCQAKLKANSYKLHVKEWSHEDSALSCKFCSQLQAMQYIKDGECFTC